MPRNKLAPPVQNALVTLDEDGNVNYPSPVNFAGLIPGPEPSGYQSRVARYLQHVLGGVDQSINAGYQSLYGRQPTVADAMGAAGLATTGSMPLGPISPGTLRMGAAIRGLPDVPMPATTKSVVPAPQRWLDPSHKEYKPNFGDAGYTPGGRYLVPGDLTDLTGITPSAASIRVTPDGKTSFKVSEEMSSLTLTPSKIAGSAVKTNLARKNSGWSWIDVPEGYPANPPGDFKLISVEHSVPKGEAGHKYALSVEYPTGVNLSRYAESNEPRLRPTVKGDVHLGNVVGKIRYRNQEHPVYDKIVVLGRGLPDKN